MWVSEKIYLDPASYIARVCQAIDQARESISLEMYIFCDDAVGLLVLNALRRAAARGVVVRIVVDGVGSPSWSDGFIASLAEQSIQARVYHPVPDLRWWRWRRHSLARARTALASLNKRNHRKLVVVDQIIGFVGSGNICQAHGGWRETAVELAGDAVADLGRSFELVWRTSRMPGSRRQALPRIRRVVTTSCSNGVRVNLTRKRRHYHNANLAQRIEQAQSRVWITSAYFVPSGAIIAALLKARRNGRDVKILLPSKSDVSLVWLVSKVFYWGLIRAGIEIHEYQPAMLHAKSLLIDDWACVGTSNINHRSLFHDLEVDVVLAASESIANLTAQFQADLRLSEEVTIEVLRRRSIMEKLGGYAAYPFRRFI